MMQKLAATAIRQAKPNPKAYKLTDGGGLYLFVHPKGGKYWRYDYRYGGKRKTLALGVYPDISLADARSKHRAAREILGSGVDPSEAKRVDKLTQNIATANSFGAIALEWFDQKMGSKEGRHKARTKSILEKDLFPIIGKRPLAKIKPPEVLAALRKIEQRGAIDLAHRAKQTASMVFRYGIATGRAESDPSRDLSGALKPKNKKKHYAAITNPKEVGDLLKAIDSFNGTLVVKTALKLSALLFQRPGEIRHMEWTEINWDESRWEIPAEKMKMGIEHIVPLPTQALDLLRELQKLTGRGRYVFPSARGASRPLSENGVRTALRTMGYTNDKMTPHGFRAMARTILDEILNIRVDWIEHQLAHAVRDTNGRAYNRTSHLRGRVEMMQLWANYLEDLKKHD